MAEAEEQKNAADGTVKKEYGNTTCKKKTTDESQNNSKSEAPKVRFIVRREFCGEQSMQDAFEGLIERRACEQFEDWLEKKAG